MLYHSAHEIHSPENVMPTQDRSETLFLNGFVGLRFDAARAPFGKSTNDLSLSSPIKYHEKWQ
jgi:hypothetical protein